MNNEFIENMSNYTGEAVKVFMAISRKTIGWHKINDRISYSQLKELTGIRHHVTIKKAIDTLVKDKWITARQTTKGNVFGLYIEKEALNDKKKTKQTMSSNDTEKPQTMSPDDNTKETNIKENINNGKVPFNNKIFYFFIDTYKHLYKENLEIEPSFSKYKITEKKVFKQLYEQHGEKGTMAIIKTYLANDFYRDLSYPIVTLQKPHVINKLRLEYKKNKPKKKMDLSGLDKIEKIKKEMKHAM
jgi:phage replication O-like protein O